MKNASLLVLVAGSTKAPDLELLLQSASSARAHLSFLVLGTMPRAPVFAYGIEPYGLPAVPDNWQEEIETAQTELTTTAKAIEAYLRGSDTSGDVGVLSCEPAALPAAIARRATTCDGVVMSNDLRDNEALFHAAVHGTLFSSPAGVILNGIGADKTLEPAQIFVAWDTGLPAARAVHASLPLLKEAADITIGLFDPIMSPEQNGENPGSDIARWLSHHGCKVTVQQYPTGGEEIGKCILGRAAETGADLVVMGAYGHSRLRQAVFGGTTRTLIEQTGMPVLLVH